MLKLSQLCKLYEQRRKVLAEPHGFAHVSLFRAQLRLLRLV